MPGLQAGATFPSLSLNPVLTLFPQTTSQQCLLSAVPQCLVYWWMMLHYWMTTCAVSTEVTSVEKPQAWFSRRSWAWEEWLLVFSSCKFLLSPWVVYGLQIKQASSSHGNGEQTHYTRGYLLQQLKCWQRRFWRAGCTSGVSFKSSPGDPSPEDWFPTKAQQGCA